MTIVRASSGTPSEKSRRGSRFGPIDVDHRPLDAGDREVARRQQDQERDENLDGRRGARVPRVARRRRRAGSRSTIAIAPR